MIAIDFHPLPPQGAVRLGGRCLASPSWGGGAQTTTHYVLNKRKFLKLMATSSRREGKSRLLEINFRLLLLPRQLPMAAPQVAGKDLTGLEKWDAKGASPSAGATWDTTRCAGIPCSVFLLSPKTSPLRNPHACSRAGDGGFASGRP